MSGLLKRIRHFRYGGSTGLNQASNSVKMTTVIAGPFIGVWFLIKVFVPVEWTDPATIFAFVCWLAYVILMYARAKGDAASYLPFPQTHWFFQDGQQVNYDLLVPPNGWEEIAEYSDGSRLFRVWFKDKMEYQDVDRPYPDVFDRALWKVPAAWTDAFKRQGHGEFFFGNIFVDHPACESIAVYVVEWKETGVGRVPVCVINSCSYAYNKVLEAAGRDIFEQGISLADSVYALYKDEEKRALELKSRNAYLEQEANQFTKEEPVDIKGLSDKRLERARKGVGSIMDTAPSLWSRITNLKTLGFVILIVGLSLLASHFWLGWP